MYVIRFRIITPHLPLTLYRLFFHRRTIYIHLFLFELVSAKYMMHTAST